MDIRRRGLEFVSELLGVFKLALDQAARPAVVTLAASANDQASDALVTGSISPRPDEGAGLEILTVAGADPVQLAALPADAVAPDMLASSRPDARQFAGPTTAQTPQTEAPALVYQTLGSGAASEASAALQIDGVARIEVAMPVAMVPFLLREGTQPDETDLTAPPMQLRSGSEIFVTPDSGSGEAPGADKAAAQASPESDAVVSAPVVPVGPSMIEPVSVIAPLSDVPALPVPPLLAPLVPAPQPLEPKLVRDVPAPEPEPKPEPEPELPRVVVINGNEFYGTALADGIIGTSANDYFEGYAGNDTIDGAGGRNSVSYWSSGGTSGAQVDLGTGKVTDTYGDQDILLNIHSIRGSENDDAILGDVAGNFLRGDDGDDLISGRSGDDALFGGAGADTLTGGDGRETLVGGQGADLIDGGEGYDLLDYSLDGGEAGISVNLKTGFIIDSWGDEDTASQIEELRATDRDDFIRLSDDGVRVVMGGGDDWVFGGDGEDVFAVGSEIGIFGPDTGRDRLYNYDVFHDVLDLAAAGYESLDDVLARAVGIDLGVALDDGHGNVITLVDVNIKQLSQMSYLFA